MLQQAGGSFIQLNLWAASAHHFLGRAIGVGTFGSRTEVFVSSLCNSSDLGWWEVLLDLLLL